MIFQIYKNGEEILLSLRPKNSQVNIFIASCNKITDKDFQEIFENFNDWEKQLLALDINIESMPETYALLISYLKEEKKSEINAQRDVNMSRSVLCKINGVEHYFQRDLKAELSWKTTKNINRTYEWITEGNKIVTLSVSNIESICNHIDLRDTTESIQARKRKDALLILEAAKEIESFNITQIFV
jgi:hypothetical protein